MTFNGIKFDQLVEWAKEDPSKLEAFRRTEVDKIIEQASPETQRRLRGLQFQIDSHCQIHKSPVGRCVQISRMMQESLQELSSAIYGVDPSTHNRAEGALDKRENIIPFPSAVSP